MEIDAKKFEELKFCGEKKEAIEYAYLFLTVRSRSEKEMRDRLKRKGFSSEVIHSVIPELKSQNLIDDLKLAKNLTESLLKEQLCGRDRVREQLIQKGIDPDLAEKITQKVEDEKPGEILNEEERAYQLLLKRKKQMISLDSHTIYRRLFNYLSRMGFQFDTIEKVMNRYQKETHAQKIN